jgi:excinuclease UvrABC nuclease subunit
MKYIFYSIKSIEDDEIIYVGSTTNYKNRLSRHKHNCNKLNNEKYYVPLYKYIREQGGFDQFKFEIIEQSEYDNKNDALMIENKYINEYKPKCNITTPGAIINAGSEDEYKKMYRQANKQKISEYNKQYRARKKAEKIQNITINNSNNISININ